MDAQMGNPHLINLLWLVGCLVLAGVVSIALRRRRQIQFFGKAEAVPQRGAAEAFSIFLTTLALVLLVVALLDLRWGKTAREVPQKGIEVMFVLDVSRSMLATDVSPNRLDRAKQQIKDMVAEMAGDRIGLVVFAGEAKQAVPLTSHYEDFKQVLDEVGPHSINRGGSRLGDAMQKAVDGFMSKTADHKAIVLITDGEDQESRPVEVARKAYSDQGVRVFAVGLGDSEQGATIPDSGRRGRGVVEYEGEPVWSKLNGEILSAVASESDGAYIPAGVLQVPMGQVYHRYVASIEQTEFETASFQAYVPRFQGFASLACGLFLLEIWWRTRPTEPPRRKSEAEEVPDTPDVSDEHDQDLKEVA